MTVEDPEKNLPPPKLNPHALDRIRNGQNFGLAVIAGLGGALAGAIAWAVVTNLTGWQIGYMSFVVGLAAGYAVKKAGKGFDLKFGVLGAIYALMGSALGDLLSAGAFHADRIHVPPLEYFGRQNISSLADIYARWVSLDTVLFYGIAIYVAYHNSFKYRPPKIQSGKGSAAAKVTPGDQIAMTSYIERIMAQKGSATTQYELGKRYRDGKGVPKDPAEAVKWFLMAAEKGYPAAQFEVGWLNESGTGVKQDRDEAMKWYIKAAEQGYTRAQNEIGHRYAAGHGVKKDPEEAYF